MSFSFMCLINEDKWSSFNNTEDLVLLAEDVDELTIENVRIKNPDNPANLIDAKLIKYNK